MLRIETQSADLILYNAAVHTIDSANTVAQAIALRGSRILAVGDSGEVLSLRGPETVCIDAEGRSVIPGINDSHNHMWEAGMLMEGIITFGYPSIAALAEEVGRRTAAMAPGAWLQQIPSLSSCPISYTG